jgi:hypothetical protein
MCFKGKIIKENLQILGTKRAQTYIEVSCSNAELSFISCHGPQLEATVTKFTIVGFYDSDERFGLLFLMLSKKFQWSILSLLCLSVHPSVRANISEIDVVDKKCSLRQRLVDQGLSRSFWKVRGHSEHIKESNFKMSSYMKFTFYQKLILIEHTYWREKVTEGHFVRSRSLSACTLFEGGNRISTVLTGI